MPCSGQYLGGCCDQQICDPSKIELVASVTGIASGGDVANVTVLDVFRQIHEFVDGTPFENGVAVTKSWGDFGPGWEGELSRTGLGQSPCFSRLVVYNYLAHGEYLGEGRRYGNHVLYQKIRIRLTGRSCVRESSSIGGIYFQKYTGNPFGYPGIPGEFGGVDAGIYDLIPGGSPGFDGPTRFDTTSGIGGIEVRERGSAPNLTCQ